METGRGTTFGGPARVRSQADSRRTRAVRLAGAGILLLVLCFTDGAGARPLTRFLNTPPVVTSQPVNVMVETGQSASFTSTASGTPVPTVQWESSFDSGKTWKEIAKATSTTYTIATTENNQNTLQYRARFHNSVATVYSEAAILTVGQKPVVTKSPASVAVGVGSPATFEAGDTASPFAETQWELSTDSGATWNPLPGEHLPTLTVIPPSLSYTGYEYRARFTNVFGSVVTSAAILKVQSIAKVTLQPEEVTILAGGSASFESASTGGFPEPEVQWEVSSDGGSTWSNVAGANSDRLTISPTLLSESGNEYRAAFINGAGTARSEAASLFVSANDYSPFGWGLNIHGQAGVGSDESSIPAPLPIKGPSFVTAVSGGKGHSLALLANGTVEAWGFDSHGQLGNEGAIATRTPVLVEHLKGVSAVAAGGNHSLALLKNGTVLAWGDDESGQLGNGQLVDSEVPVAVPGLTNVTAIAAGEEHSLALLSNGTVMAWGNNEDGQLGVGGKAVRKTPVEVSGLSEVSAIAADGRFSMALLKNGTVVAWGDDEHGQLGNKPLFEKGEEGAFSSSPVPVEGLSGVSAIAAGRNHALALLSNGTVEAWGNDAEGELGNGIIEPQAVTAVPVSGLSGVVAISAGEQDSVALLSSGTIEAWGTNGAGALGIGATGPASDLPVEVHSITGAAGVSAGGGQVLAFGASLPSVTAISPPSGPTGGSQTVTITGTGLSGATAVHFGASLATGLVVNSSNSVTATSPAGTGTVNVTVTTPSGTSPVSSGDRYSYRPAPTVAKLSVKGGPAKGGTTVEITGTELIGATEVDFGAVAVTELTVNSATSIAVVSPQNVGGTADVRVMTPSGLSAVTTKGAFRYAPEIVGVSPANGPKAGGGSVTISGYGFVPGTSGTSFKFGKAKVTTEECASTTSCTVVLPASKTTVTVDVTAKVGRGKTPIVAGDHFTYE